MQGREKYLKNKKILQLRCQLLEVRSLSKYRYTFFLIYFIEI